MKAKAKIEVGDRVMVKRVANADERIGLDVASTVGMLDAMVMLAVGLRVVAMDVAMGDQTLAEELINSALQGTGAGVVSRCDQ